MPFKDGVFDRELAESVLVFCDKGLVAREAYRTLKSNGLFGDNEQTLLKPPPEELDALLSSPGSGLGVVSLLENDWRRSFEEAGLKFSSYVGYGLYVYKKAEKSVSTKG